MDLFSCTWPVCFGVRTAKHTRMLRWKHLTDCPAINYKTKQKKRKRFNFSISFPRSLACSHTRIAGKNEREKSVGISFGFFPKCEHADSIRYRSTAKCMAFAWVNSDCKLNACFSLAHTIIMPKPMAFHAPMEWAIFRSGQLNHKSLENWMKYVHCSEF